MAVLEVYEYPHPVLKKKALPVEKVDDDLRKLMDDMLETMYAAVGVGLAAPQIGQSIRVLVIDYEQEEDENGNRIKGNPRYLRNFGKLHFENFVEKNFFAFFYDCFETYVLFGQTVSYGASDKKSHYKRFFHNTSLLLLLFHRIATLLSKKLEKQIRPRRRIM